MTDRILCRLGSRPVLLGSAALTLLLLALSFFTPALGLPPWLALPFAGAFGVGGAARDLGLSAPRPRRADPIAIAVLEYELLGIEPEPGTAAAFAVSLRRTFGTHDGERVGTVDFPPSMTASEIDTWRAIYEHTAANTITVPKPGGGVELLYVDPSGRHRQPEPRPGARPYVR